MICLGVIARAEIASSRPISRMLSHHQRGGFAHSKDSPRHLKDLHHGALWASTSACDANFTNRVVSSDRSCFGEYDDEFPTKRPGQGSCSGSQSLRVERPPRKSRADPGLLLAAAQGAPAGLPPLSSRLSGFLGLSSGLNLHSDYHSR